MSAHTVRRVLARAPGIGNDLSPDRGARWTHPDQTGYRAGHYPRSLVTRVGKLELRVSRDREGRFSTELFERYQRSEKVREEGVIRSQTVLIAISINWDGRRQILGVEMTNRESRSTWKDFLARLRDRGLHGVEFVVSNDHDRLRKVIRDIFKEATWQRCYVHFLRNALGHSPRWADDDCLQELRWLYDWRNIDEHGLIWPAG